MQKTRIIFWVTLLGVLGACNFPAALATQTPVSEATATAPPITTQPAPPTQPDATLTIEPAEVEIKVYFTDEAAYALGTPPFERAVTRRVSADATLPEAVLNEFFKGPTEAEIAEGLALIASGFTGYSRIEMQDGIARVYLIGPCASNGATYTIAQPLMTNLLQFDEIQWVKIYDAEGGTEVPDGDSNSIPFCLEP